MAIWQPPKSVKNKSGKTFDPTRHRTKELIKNADAVAKAQEKAIKSGKYSVDIKRD